MGDESKGDLDAFSPICRTHEPVGVTGILLVHAIGTGFVLQPILEFVSLRNEQRNRTRDRDLKRAIVTSSERAHRHEAVIKQRCFQPRVFRAAIFE